MIRTVSHCSRRHVGTRARPSLLQNRPASGAVTGRASDAGEIRVAAEKQERRGAAGEGVNSP